MTFKKSVNSVKILLIHGIGNKQYFEQSLISANLLQ